MRLDTRTRRGLLLVGLAVVAGSLLYCSPGYLIRAGLAEAEILSRREPIDRVIEAPGTDPGTRAKLVLVRNVQTFAGRELGLDVGDSYTTFSQLDTDTLLLVVTAAPKDALRPHTWWFPIVGRVPYKGFFDPADARAEARRLSERGYDVAVRPSDAFSTLGWFDDPLLSTVLDRDEVALAATVIHELTHSTTFVKDRVAFNESFANFVGDVGAAEYFCGIEGEAGPRCRLARARWHDKLIFADALGRLLAGLETVYSDVSLSYEQKLTARERVMERWRTRYTRETVPRLRVAFREFHQRPVNNAELLGLRLYYDRLDLFDRVYRESDRPLPQVVRRIAAAAEASPRSPFEAVEALVDG